MCSNPGRMLQEPFNTAKRNDGKFYYAVTRGDYRTVQSELRRGDVDLELIIGGKSFLRHAGERGYKEIAAMLIEAGMDPNEVAGRREHSLLHHASLTYNFGFASLLLEKKAVPSPRSSNRTTPLHLAARTGQQYLAKRLIDFHEEVNAQDTRGRTPLFLAMKSGHAKLAKMLIASNGNPRIANREGVTALQVAEELGLDV